MELICPDCRADLVSVDAQTATCAGHNGRYQVLFDRSLGDAQPGTQAAAERPAAAVAGPPSLGIQCRQHPEIDAVARCRLCHRGVCATCDFLLPGNVHVCPACLEKEPSTEVSPKRRNTAIGALLIGIFVTFMFALLISGSIHRSFGNNEATNTVFGNLILWPGLIGMGMALSAFDRRLRNSPLIWTTLVWNGINVGLFLLLMIIGLAT
jgi:hypothetical protein